MPDTPTPHVDLGMFVLGKLLPAELPAFRTHLRTCPECQRELPELQELPGLLARAAPPTPPPPDLRARTLERVRLAAAEAPESIVPAQQVPTTVAPEPRPVVMRSWVSWWRRRWLPLAAGLAVTAVAVAVAVSTGSLFDFRERKPESRLYAAAVAGKHGRAEVAFTSDGDNRRADVRVENLPAAPAGSAYELWLVRPDDTPEKPQRVSLGTFVPDRRGRADFQAVTAAPAVLYNAVGVTLEPLDGNPAKSGDTILRPVPAK